MDRKKRGQKDKMARLLEVDSLKILKPQGEEDFLAFEQWLYGLEGEEKERYNQGVTEFCLKQIGLTPDEILDEAMARLDRGERRGTLPGLDAIMFYNFAHYRAREAARSRHEQ